MEDSPMMVAVGWGALMVVMFGSAVTLMALFDDAPTGDRARFGSWGGIITATGSVAFWGWRLAADASLILTPRAGIIFGSMALTLIAMGMLIAAGLLRCSVADRAQGSAWTQRVQWVLHRAALIIAGSALLTCWIDAAP